MVFLVLHRLFTNYCRILKRKIFNQRVLQSNKILIEELCIRFDISRKPELYVVWFHQRQKGNRCRFRMATTNA